MQSQSTPAPPTKLVSAAASSNTVPPAVPGGGGGLSAALALAAQGFHVFPLVAGGKLPAVADFANVSTRDPERLRELFWCGVMNRDHGFNVGIYTGKFGDDPAASLVVIDVDNKNGKNGTAELNALGPALGLPATYTQWTPTGGFHVVYRSQRPVANSVGAAGRSQWPAGLDIRGTGGFIVGAGSSVPAGTYHGRSALLADAPAALLAKCEPYTPPRTEGSTEAPEGIDSAAAKARAVAYLTRDATPSIEGAGGDINAFQVCARVKDFGVSEADALELLLEHWNPRCAPPWEAADLQRKVANAFAYGRKEPGCAAPEMLFKPGPDGSSDAGDVIAALAALPLLEYEQRRKEEAKRLGLRPSVLDELVDAKRPEADDDGSADLFPAVEPWPHPVAAGAVLSEVRDLFRRYLVCDESSRVTLSLWAVWTWLVESGDCCPILALLSPEPRCGKSTALALLSRLTYRPLAVASVSPAALYRTVELWHPTLLIDEVDAFLKDNEELRGVINSGHTRDTAFVLRTVGDDHTPVRFSTWGAKSVAGIGRLPHTIADRALLVPLRRKLSGEVCARLTYNDRHLDTARRIARLAAEAVAPLRSAQTATDVPSGLNDRQADGWRPLLALADYAGGEWPQLAREAALAGIGGDAERAEGYSTALLRDIRDVFDSRKVERLATADLLAALNGDEEKPWGTLLAGRPLNAHRLANMLKSYGVSPKTLRLPPGHFGSSARVNSAGLSKGYERESFNEAWSRYLGS